MPPLVHKSINDLALLLDKIPSPINHKLKYFLKCLQTLLLCARNLATSIDQEPLMVRLNEMLIRNVESFKPYGRGGYPHTVLIDFETDVKSFEMEIDASYETLLGFLQLQRSYSQMLDDVLDTIDSVLVNLEDFHSSNIYGIGDATEVMEEKIRLFRSFIRFVAVHGVENQDFAIRVAGVAVSAARVTSKLSYVCLSWKPEGWKQMQSDILVLLQMIAPVGSQVFEAYSYIAALVDCKNSPSLSLDQDGIGVMKDFIDFLLQGLRETSQMDSWMMKSSNQEDQLHQLWKGLRFLRTILKRQPGKFDYNLCRVMICDAGVLIFSMHQKDFVIDPGLSDTLEKFEMIRGEVEDQNPEASTSNLPKSVVDFLNFLLGCLMEMKTSEVLHDAQSRIQAIIEDLKSSMDVLVELQNQRPLWDFAVQVATVASRIQVLVDQLVLGGVSDSFPSSLDSIAEDAAALMVCVSNASYGSRTNEMDYKGVASISTQAPPQITNAEVASFEDVIKPQSSTLAPTQVIGFEEEKRSIINQLRSRSRDLKVVLIVGMAGLGKTTIATQVFNDPAIRSHFHVRGWCSVSLELNQKKTLLDLLSQTVSNLPDVYFNMSVNDLELALYKSLKRCRYLILLDDLWDIEAWYKLIVSLPDDSYGSRILVTSRHSGVVPKAMLVDEQPYFLRDLTDDESWDLLKNKLFSAGDCPQKLCEVGQKIAYCCKGLPLTVVIISGLLTSLKLDVWVEVLKSLNSGTISLDQQCIKALKMSYDYLPESLKPCFLYFGLFPEDQQISVKRLMRLWIAEGLVRKNHDTESLEFIATNYMMVLARRSLVTISENGSTGGAKACRIHDLLHDFCITRAKKENFVHCLRGHDEILTFEEPFYLPRLSIHSRKRDFKNLRPLRPNVQSLQFFPQNESGQNVVYDISYFIQFFKHLRVLDIMQIDLGYVFPNEMELLARLRFLAVKGRLSDLPSSIGNLSKLETFIVDSTNAVALPHTIWNLHKLRNLCIQNGFLFPTDDLSNCSGLDELDTCTTAIISSWDVCEKLMEKFPKIRRLKCRVFKSWDTENCNKILIQSSLNLKSLHVSLFGQGLLFVWHKVLKHVQFEFCFPENLTKLTLDRFKLSQTETTIIGELPNLEVLKLLNVSFFGGIFHMIEGEFSNLKFLKLSDSTIAGWTTDDEGEFPPLRKLVLKSCKKLKEIPSSLETSNVLEMIEVIDCSQSVERAVKRIKATQESYGYSDLKILVSL